ncbi:MAG: hypothetical protein RI988_3473 [Pseudomonadota bacterium]|jgi:hypothetical protein
MTLQFIIAALWLALFAHSMYSIGVSSDRAGWWLAAIAQAVLAINTFIGAFAE